MRTDEDRPLEEARVRTTRETVGDNSKVCVCPLSLHNILFPYV